MARAIKQKSTVERFVSYAAATAFAGLLCFLLIRNEPFADPNLATLFRVSLSISLAILGATLPGFLGIRYAGKRLALRATGGIGIFLISLAATSRIIPVRKSKTTATAPVDHGQTIQQQTHGDQSPAAIGSAVVINYADTPRPANSK